MINLLASTNTSAASEPRTSAAATTKFPRFSDDATFKACGSDRCRRGYLRTCVDWLKHRHMKHEITYHLLCERVYLPIIRLWLTFAGLGTIEPHVFNVPVTGASAVLVPRTARSATTNFAGFSELAALWAHHGTSGR